MTFSPPARTGLRTGRSAARGDRERHLDPELRALALACSRSRSAAEQLRSAPWRSSCRGRCRRSGAVARVGLLERLEDPRLRRLSGMPMPVSRTENRSSARFLGRRRGGSPSTSTLPLLGELDRVRNEVDQHLAQVTDVAVQRVRHVARDVDARTRGFLRARDRLQHQLDAAAACRRDRNRRRCA